MIMRALDWVRVVIVILGLSAFLSFLLYPIEIIHLSGCTKYFQVIIHISSSGVRP